MKKQRERQARYRQRKKEREAADEASATTRRQCEEQNGVLDKKREKQREYKQKYRDNLTPQKRRRQNEKQKHPKCVNFQDFTGKCVKVRGSAFQPRMCSKHDIFIMYVQIAL